MFRQVLQWPRKPVLWVIRGYQRILSPDHSWMKVFYPHGGCKYRPTCSEYTYQAVDRYGIWRGLALGGWRLLRCNPWSHGGNDPVPDK